MYAGYIPSSMELWAGLSVFPSSFAVDFEGPPNGTPCKVQPEQCAHHHIPPPEFEVTTLNVAKDRQSLIH